MSVVHLKQKDLSRSTGERDQVLAQVRPEIKLFVFPKRELPKNLFHLVFCEDFNLGCFILESCLPFQLYKYM